VIEQKASDSSGDVIIKKKTTVTPADSDAT
jgi:hypothetical protein